VKILLIQSYLGGNEPVVYPIGLACLASALRDHDVTLFDTNTSPRPFEELGEILAKTAPDVIGISLRNIDSTNKRTVVFYYRYLKQTIDVIKSRSKAAIVIGGSGFSMFAREIMEDEPRIDYGISREGEHTFPLLLNNLGSPEKAPSVYYRKNGALAITAPGPQVDLNAVSLPDRTHLPIEAYCSAAEAVGIETKRGCALGCVYCIYGFLNGKTLRLREPARIVDEIELLVKNQGLRRFTFVDSVFNIPQGHAESICRELIRRKLSVTWSAWFNEKGITREFIELAREAGCRNVILSPDGFSGATLKALGKNISFADIEACYGVLKNLDGFEVSYNFFKNPPAQDFGAFLSLLRFTARAKKEMGRRVHFEFNSMRIEPNTKLFDIARAEGFVTEGENLLYPKYYTHRKTRAVEMIFNLLLRLKGK
jgi:putative variant cofactor biosynthesis B12-binding/radical SAM domain protein 1